MVVKYIICGPVVAAVCCATLLTADVALLPALIISWVLGSLAVTALAVYAVYCCPPTERDAQKDSKKAARSGVDNIPTSG